MSTSLRVIFVHMPQVIVVPCKLLAAWFAVAVIILRYTVVLGICLMRGPVVAVHVSLFGSHVGAARLGHARDLRIVLFIVLAVLDH
jgi:hypothetical protein